MPSDLSSLLSEATRYARFTMKKCVCLAPIMMAATDQCTILFTPDKLSDFANKVRLITASYGASAVVLILESWISKAKADEPLDTLTLPSESYDREEVVVLIGEAPQGNINRLGNGKFWNLGDAEDMPADSFVGLLKPKPSDDQTRQMGKMLLQAMGVKVGMLK